MDTADTNDDNQKMPPLNNSDSSENIFYEDEEDQKDQENYKKDIIQECYYNLKKEIRDFLSEGQFRALPEHIRSLLSKSAFPLKNLESLCKISLTNTTVSDRDFYEDQEENQKDIIQKCYHKLKKEIKDVLSEGQFRDLPEHVRILLSQTTFSLNQLEYINKIPWHNTEVPDIDFAKAQKILEESHYGMKEVKERIIRYIACQKHIGANYGAVLFLLGPPGVGKTSIAKSIADAMDRKFEKISLAGITDASYLKGYNRNYKHAKPGLIIEALIRSESLCPLILLDEVDKAGRSTEHGDPAHVLLDILDSDRSRFTDSLIDIPVDLSNVIFVLTANDSSLISPILLDRLEEVKLKGYNLDEKIQIAQTHLIPSLIKRYQLQDEDMQLSKEIIQYMIEIYTHEPGIRSLERTIKQTCEAVISYIYTGRIYEKNLTIIDLDNMLNFSNPDTPAPIIKVKPKSKKAKRTSTLIYKARDEYGF